MGGQEGSSPGDEPESAAETAKGTSNRIAFAGATVGLVGALTVGLLNLVGAGTGIVVTLLGVAGLVGAFLVAIRKSLQEQFLHASSRRKIAYVTGTVGLAAILTVLGVLTKEDPALTRLPGTRDVALLGFQAPSKEAQPGYDDFAASLAESLPPPEDGSVENYTSETDAPLNLLQSPPDAQDDLQRFMVRFLDDTDAELVVAGYGVAHPSGQTALIIYTYVPPTMLDDATEISGWYPLMEELLDGGLDSASARRALVGQITQQLDGLNSFLSGLDAWQTGYYGNARKMFTSVIARSPTTPSLLQALARLLRGHASEASSQRATSARVRQDLLREARTDYQSVATHAVLAPRASLSLATNDYLQAVAEGCGSASLRKTLARSSAALAALAADQSLAELIRLKAKVNRAQVEQCRSYGPSASDDLLRALIVELLEFPVAEDDPDAQAKRWIKALAHTIAATEHARAGQLPEAVRSLDDALALDPRFERQGLWLGLKSTWLLADGCSHVDAGKAAQEASLEQIAAAVKADRLPPASLDQYAKAFSTDLEAARNRCA